MNITEIVDMHPKDEIEVMDGEEVQPHFEDQTVGDTIIDIKAMLQDSKEPHMSDKCCIYKVPRVIRQQNEDAYTPKVVSIGPFHRRDRRLQNMEAHKIKLLKKFICESDEPNLDDLVSFVNILEPRVRACYSEKIEPNKKDFVKVILVDAIFIIQVFRKGHKAWSSWLGSQLTDDLLLLENQLPYFILEELYNRAFTPQVGGHLPSFLELSFRFFTHYNRQHLKPDPNVKINHFTDLLRIFYLPEKKPKTDIESQFLSYNASELHEAGLKLRKNNNKCLLELKFSGNTLEIPHIEVDGRTETLFRNVIALEQFHYPDEPYIIYYASMLDDLINTSKDVDLLVRKDIIDNGLADSNDVTQLYNGLCKGIVASNCNSDYSDICTKLNAFYKNPWKRKKADLRRDYCNTPWLEYCCFHCWNCSPYSHTCSGSLFSHPIVIVDFNLCNLSV